MRLVFFDFRQEAPRLRQEVKRWRFHRHSLQPRPFWCAPARRIPSATRVCGRHRRPQRLLERTKHRLDCRASKSKFLSMIWAGVPEFDHDAHSLTELVPSSRPSWHPFRPSERALLPERRPRHPSSRSVRTRGHARTPRSLGQSHRGDRRISRVQLYPGR